jgi:hypothetical protein
MQGNIAMKSFLVCLLCSGLLLVCYQDLQAKDKPECRKIQVPDSFKYPEAMGIVSLSGIITAPNGVALEKVLVERTTRNWEKRIEATFTDSKGCFFFPNTFPGYQYLRFSLPGSGTLQVRVKINKRSRSRLRLELPIAS